MTRQRATWVALRLLACPVTGGEDAACRPARRTPLICFTDLFHPHEDPDDHFDLATVQALTEFDVRGIVLDQRVRRILRFRMRDRERYAPDLTAATAAILARFPAAP